MTEAQSSIIQSMQVPKDSQVSLSIINQELNTLLQFSGAQTGGFVADTKVSNLHNCTAVKSLPLKVVGLEDGKTDHFALADREINVRFQNSMDGFKGGINNIKASMTETTFVAGKALLEDVLSKQGVTDEKYKEEVRAGLTAIESNYVESLNNLRAAAQKKYGAKFTEMSVFDKKLIPNFKSIQRATRDEIASYLYHQEQSKDPAIISPIQPDWHREWITALQDKEKDVLSAIKRNPQVVEFADDPTLEKPGRMVEIAWPLSDISSLDRRQTATPEAQKRPNFWLQINIHLDSEGNELSRSVFYRGASHNVLEAKGKKARFAATKDVVRNELRLYAFMHIRAALMQDPNLSVADIMQNFNRIHASNLGLQATWLKDYDCIAETRSAFQAVMKECQAKGGIDLGPELAAELARICKREELAELGATVWIQPTIRHDNLASNGARGADTNKAFLRRVIGMEPLQVNIRKAANLDRIDDFVTKINAISGNNKRLASLNPLLYTLKKFQTECAKPSVNIVAEWDKVRDTYKQQLAELKKEIENPFDRNSLLAVQYDNLVMFGMHMEHNLKPQICPTTVTNFLFKITDEKMSFIRQCITAENEERLAAQLDPSKKRIGLAEIFAANCLSGKDRTGMFAVFKEAMQIVLDNEKLAGRPLDINNMDEYVAKIRQQVPHVLAKTVGRYIAGINCPGSWSFLGQNRFAKYNILYAKSFVETLELDDHNKIGRLNKARWSGITKFFGKDGALTAQNKNANPSSLDKPKMSTDDEQYWSIKKVIDAMQKYFFGNTKPALTSEKSLHSLSTSTSSRVSTSQASVKDKESTDEALIGQNPDKKKFKL